MRPFGFIILFIIFYIFIKNRCLDNIYIKFLTLAICIETFINVGYFVLIGTYELEYSEVLLAILGFFSVIIICHKRFNRKIFFLGFLFLFSVTVSCMALILFPLKYPIITYGMSWGNYFIGQTVLPEFTIQTVKMTLRIILYILIVIATTTVVNKENIHYIKKTFINCGIFVIILALMEFIAKNVFLSNIFNSFISWFFGMGSSTVEILLERDNIYSLQGFMREPAHFASAMFWFGLVLIWSNKKKSWRILICICFVLLLSRSFAALIYISSLYIIYAIVNNKKFIHFVLAICVFPLFLFSNFFNYYFNRVINVLSLLTITEASRALSEHVRLISIMENFNIFLHRPFWGIGIGTSYAHGFLPTILATMGLIGSILWVIFIFYGTAKIKFRSKNIFLVLILLVCWVFTGSMATTYSMALLLLALLLRYDCIRSNATL